MNRSECPNLTTQQEGPYLGGAWGMADHLIWLLAVPDVVLLLMEKGEARRNVAGHQICVLDENSSLFSLGWPVSSLKVSLFFYNSHTRTHTVTRKDVR